MVSDNDVSKERNNKRWVIILLVLLLVCGCVGLIVGRPVIEGVLSDGATATSAPTEEVTQPPTEEPTETATFTEEPTETLVSTEEPTETPTEEVTDVPPGNGACLDPCNPAGSDCLAGLACLQSGSDSTNYICWNNTICNPPCGNGICAPDENCSSCPKDCGACPACGDGVCAPGEDCSTCSADCGTCSHCGNSHCSEDENCSTCPADCGVCPYCGDGICNESPNLCPQDCRR
jgi:hypothetical protein